ncbi:MAG: hypothetical protein Q9206_007011, partial [Seirophora lacunosa]
GSIFSTNILTPVSAFTLVSGNPKIKGKSTLKGNTMTSYFCGDCGTTLWRESSGVEEGVLEEVSSDPPKIEFFSDRRAPWLAAVEGAQQHKSTE